MNTNWRWRDWREKPLHLLRLDSIVKNSYNILTYDVQPACVSSLVQIHPTFAGSEKATSAIKRGNILNTRSVACVVDYTWEMLRLFFSSSSAKFDFTLAAISPAEYHYKIIQPCRQEEDL